MSAPARITPCYALTYERRSKHPAERVWRAITDPAEVAAWMTIPARIELRVGGEYFVDFKGSSDENLDGVIVRVEPERQLAYAWGVSVVEWALEPDGDGCRYRFVHHGMPIRGIPDEEGVAAGWHVWLDDLEDFLSGHPASPAQKGAAYASRAAEYRKSLEAVLP